MDPRSAPPEPPRSPQDEPVAPEPQWGEPPIPRPFDREKFLLLVFLGIVIAQYAFLAVAMSLCLVAAVGLPGGVSSLPPEERAGCQNLPVRSTFESSLNVVLALLGGAALATGRTAQDFSRGAGRRNDPRRP